MTAQTIVAAVNARLTELDITLLEFEPTSVAPPLAYTLVMGVDYAASGGAVAVVYRVRVRVCIRWQEQAAEGELLALLETVPMALGGGVLAGTSGARLAVSRAETGFATIGGVKCRVLDVWCEVGKGIVREGVC